MNNKEFEDFFKDLDPNDIPVVDDEDDGEDFAFSSFFEDETSSVKKEEKIEQEPETVAPAKKELVFEEETTEPEEEDVFPDPDPEPVKKKTPSAKSKKTSVKNKKKKYNTIYNWLITVVWVSAVLAVSVFIASFALSSINDLVGFSKESKEVQITIPEGYDLSEIAELLKDNGVIDEPFTFEVYARVKDMDQKLDSGICKFRLI